MAKFVNNGTINPENIENPESIMINSRIKEFITLTEAVEKSDKNVEYWSNQTSKLLTSNHNIEINYDKLVQKVHDIDAQISENIRIHLTKKQELKNFENARANISHKQCEDGLSEIGNYANNFSQWIVEYSRDVLMKDIENYHKECTKVGDELAILKKDLDDMKRKYDSDYIKANVDVNDLQNLNTVMSDVKLNNNNLMHTVRLTEDTLNKIQSKITQNKIAVNKYKSKETNIL